MIILGTKNSKFICVLKELVSEQSDKCNEPIPIMLYTKNGNLFDVEVILGQDHYFNSPYFLIKLIDEEKCCAILASLEPLGIDGCTVEFPEGCIYTLVETDQQISVNLCDFCGVRTLPSKMMNRQLPLFQPKDLN